MMLKVNNGKVSSTFMQCNEQWVLHKQTDLEFINTVLFLTGFILSTAFHHALHPVQFTGKPPHQSWHVRLLFTRRDVMNTFTIPNYGDSI